MLDAVHTCSAHLQASGNAAPSSLHTLMQYALASACAFFSDVCLYEKVLHPSELRTSQYERHSVCVSTTFGVLPFDAFDAAAGAFAAFDAAAGAFDADGSALGDTFGTFALPLFFDAGSGAFESFAILGPSFSSSVLGSSCFRFACFFASIAACAAANASSTFIFLCISAVRTASSAASWLTGGACNAGSSAGTCDNNGDATDTRSSVRLRIAATQVKCRFAVSRYAL